MSAASGIGSSASELQANYLNLLVTQLKNQDPLDPMNNDQMTSQLAQISQVQELEGLSASFSSILALTQKEQAASLIGKQVTFTPNGADTPVTDRVTGVDMSTGQAFLLTGSGAVSPDNVSAIQE